ncbi:MAG: AAA family ATPase [Lachnospiraceae bacterium]
MWQNSEYVYAEGIFEIGADPAWFEELKISKEKDLCDKHLGKYPVIFMSLKEVSGLNYEEAVSKFRDLMAEIIGKYEFMLYDHKLSAFQRQRLEEMLLGDWSGVNLSLSLKILSDILFQYYERRVIILIDEHDVPWIRRISTVIMKSWSLLSGAFWSYVEKQQQSGLCSVDRLSENFKESIFTGLNNFDVRTISDVQFDECFGLTDAEVQQMMDDYQLNAYYMEAKEWYDGYVFGRKYVYCPWTKIVDHTAEPFDYWINSSSNSIIREFLSKREYDVSEKFERLLQGEAILEELSENLTYDEVMDSGVKYLEPALCIRLSDEGFIQGQLFCRQKKCF